MALLTVSGEPGCPVEEVARLVAQRLDFEIFTESAVRTLVEEQFGSEVSLPDKAYPHLLASILAKLATEYHLVACIPGVEFLLRDYTAALRAALVAPSSHRIGTLMLDHHLERSAAMEMLKKLDEERKQQRRHRFGRATIPPHLFDLTLNAASMDAEVLAEFLAFAAAKRGLPGQGLLAAEAEAEIQFKIRLQLAKYRIRPPGEVSLKHKVFVHPSEEIFAHLLDFYRIAWEYEPRSFPLQWDKDGKVLGAFTPDFYLPEFDLYVELTTMKQALVTKKNRKIRLLRQIYPGVSIQVFYQKDFQNLIFKYGLTDRATRT